MPYNAITEDLSSLNHFPITGITEALSNSCNAHFLTGLWSSALISHARTVYSVHTPV